MPKSIWTGSISFGLVNIPVKLYPAVQSKQLRFHMLHEKDKSRVNQRIYCAAEQKEISREDTIKGFPISKEEIVPIKPEELDALKPEGTHSIDIIHFVALNSIDSVYFHQPHYLVPEKRAAKAYTLLLEAMKKADKVAIATFVMRDNQHLAALRAMGDAIGLETMYYKDEIVSPAALEDMPEQKAPSAAELKMADQLIASLSEKFHPEKYHDEYREAVLAMVKKKAKGGKIVAAPARAEKPAKVVDLMSALKASLRESDGKRKRAA